MKILVTGATGFVGSHLVPALIDAGHDPLAGTRHVDDHHGPAQPVTLDMGDRDQIGSALDGCDAAYYLVHAMEGDPGTDFRRSPPGGSRCSSVSRSRWSHR